MKKLISLLTGGLVKDIGDVIDKVTTTEEERLDTSTCHGVSYNHVYFVSVYGWKHRWFPGAKRLHTNFSIIINHSLWSVFCRAHMGKK